MRWAGPIAGIPGAVVRHVPSLPDSLPEAERAGFYAQAIPGQLLQSVPDVARYLARDGTSIDVAPEPDSDDSAIELFLNGAVRAALIHQRGELPLHAATLVAPGTNEAISICGASGMGKSTLAAELSSRGWLLIADDTTRITCDGTEATAWPGRNEIKLWRDACLNLDKDPAELERVRAGMEKFFLPVPQRDEPTPLAAIVELSQTGESGIARVSGIERVTILSEHTFRPRQIKPLGRIAEHLSIVARIASTVRFYRLNGARTLPPSQLADLLGSLATTSR